MNSPDLKKLVAGFLVLSAITSVVTLISLNFIGNASAPGQALQVEGENENSPLTTIGKNAFVEKLSTDGSRTITQSSSGNAVSPSSNLTQNFASVFAGQMLVNNPNGPQPDQNGDPTVLNLPSEDKAADMIKEALSKTNIAFDDKISVQVNKIAKSFTPDDVAAYLKQVNEILGQVSSSTKSSLAVAQQNQTTDALVLPALAIESALAKFSSLSVPKPLATLHTTFLRFLSNQKNVFNAVADYQTDPLKTIVALQNENQIIDRDISLMKDAAYKVDQKAISFGNIPEWQKLYSEIFGVKKAYAFLGIDDITFDPTNWVANWGSFGVAIEQNLADITKWLYDTALSIAINTLINEFQNQVVNWIAGNGSPKFITDWQGFLKNVADKAIGQAVSQSALSGLCSGIGPLVRVAFLPVPYANTGVRCTLSGIVNNVNNFFNSFQAGNWYAYFSVMQPANNIYGNFLLIRDRGIIDAITATDAASKQAAADKGFLSMKRCVQWDNSSEFGANCIKEEIVTPGTVVGESLSKSLGWKADSIVTAKRFEQLVAAIVNASINRIMREGLSTLTQSYFQSHPTGPSPSVNTVYASSSTSYAGVVSSTNAGQTQAGNPGSLRGILNSLISSLTQTGVLQNNQNIIDANTQWLVLKPEVITKLSQLSSSCSNLSSAALQRTSELNSFEASVRAELVNAIIIRDARIAASTVTLEQDMRDIIAVFQNIDIVAITDISAIAQTRAAAIQNILTVVTRKISSDECTGSVPSATNPTDTGTGSSTD